MTAPFPRVDPGISMIRPLMQGSIRGVSPHFVAYSKRPAGLAYGLCAGLYVTGVIFFLVRAGPLKGGGVSLRRLDARGLDDAGIFRHLAIQQVGELFRRACDYRQAIGGEPVLEQ
jgi:hypothetical protein